MKNFTIIVIIIAILFSVAMSQPAQAGEYQHPKGMWMDWGGETSIVYKGTTTEIYKSGIFSSAYIKVVHAVAIKANGVLVELKVKTNELFYVEGWPVKITGREKDNNGVWSAVICDSCNN